LIGIPGANRTQILECRGSKCDRFFTRHAD
jgi:hypothetical protein